jgi:large subunit ribosomal protein L15
MARADRRNRKLRGSRTHGYGNAQKHRGAGSRGGRGMAGSKKQKWIRVVKDNPGYFGSKGFTRHKSLVSKPNSINVGYLCDNIAGFVSEGVASESKGTYTVNLTEAGIEKLLGAGAVGVKLKVTVDACSKKAKDKILAAGGSVDSGSQDLEAEADASGDSVADDVTGE